MRAFELYDATTVAQAVDLLKQNSSRATKVVGGGSDLIGGILKDWVHGAGPKLQWNPRIDGLVLFTEMSLNP